MIPLSPAGTSAVRQPWRCERGRVLVLGDSLAGGATVIDRERILQRVECSMVDHLVRRAPHMSVTVDAAPWRRTPELVGLLPAALDTARPDLVVIVSGANDGDIEWKRFVVSKGRIIRNGTRLNDFTAALAALSGLCSQHGAAMILAEIIAPSLRLRAPLLSKAAGFDLWPILEQSGGQQACDRIVASYRAAAESQALQSGFRVARTGSVLDGADQELVYAEDGAHPNDEGHLRMADMLARCVLEPLERAA